MIFFITKTYSNKINMTSDWCQKFIDKARIVHGDKYVLHQAKARIK